MSIYFINFIFIKESQKINPAFFFFSFHKNIKQHVFNIINKSAY